MARVRVTSTTRGSVTAAATAASNAAVRAIAAELNGRFQDALGSKVWEWPNETKRSNGQIVGSPRTIVDSGILRASNSFQVEGPVAFFRWSVNYASAIHEGATLRNGGTIYPRPWTRAVMGDETVAGVQPYDYRRAMFDRWLNHFLNAQS